MRGGGKSSNIASESDWGRCRVTCIMEHFRVYADAIIAHIKTKEAVSNIKLSITEKKRKKIVNLLA